MGFIFGLSYLTYLFGHFLSHKMSTTSTNHIYRYKANNRWHEFDKSILSPADLVLFDKANWADKLKIITVYNELQPATKVNTVQLKTKKEDARKDIRRSNYDKRKQAINTLIDKAALKLDTMAEDDENRQIEEDKIKGYMKQLDNLAVEYADVVDIKSVNDMNITTAQNIRVTNAANVVTEMQDKLNSVEKSINKLSNALTPDDLADIKESIAEILKTRDNSENIADIKENVDKLMQVRDDRDDTAEELEKLREKIEELKQSVNQSARNTLTSLLERVEQLVALKETKPEIVNMIKALSGNEDITKAAVNVLKDYQPSELETITKYITADEATDFKYKAKPIQFITALATLREIYAQANTWLETVEGLTVIRINLLNPRPRSDRDIGDTKEHMYYLHKSNETNNLLERYKLYIKEYINGYSGNVYLSYSTSGVGSKQYEFKENKRYHIDATGIDINSLIDNIDRQVGQGIQGETSCGRIGIFSKLRNASINKKDKTKPLSAENASDELVERLTASITEKLTETLTESITKAISEAFTASLNQRESRKYTQPVTKPSISNSFTANELTSSKAKLKPVTDVDKRSLYRDNTEYASTEPTDLTSMLAKKMADRRKDIEPDTYENVDDQDDEWADGFKEALKIVNYIKRANKSQPANYKNIKALYHDLYD